MARTKLEVQVFKGAGSGERPAAGAVGPARGKLTVFYDTDTDTVYLARLASGVLTYEAVTGAGSVVSALTTRGDVLTRGASGVTRLALGTSGQVLSSNGTDLVWVTLSSVALASTAPAALASAAAVGVGATAARADHVHPTTGLCVLAATAAQTVTASDNATGITRPVVLSHESSGSLGAGYGVGLAFYEGGTGAASLRGAVDVVRESGGGSGLSVSLKASGAPDAAELLTLSSAGRLTTAETIRPFRGTVAQITGGVFIVAPGPACIAFATNGRKPGESAGNGTGVPCFHDGSGWFSFCDGAALAA